MRNQFFLLAMMATICACSPSMRTTSSWVNSDKSVTANKTYKTIFISVITSKLELRVKMENEMAMAAQRHGYIAIKSIDKFPPVAGGKKLTHDEALDIIRKTGADAILTTSVVDEKSETKYVPGTVTYSPRFYSGYRGYYSGVYGTWGYATPGYYTTDKTYFLETNVFDAASEATLWSCQSEVYNPSNIEHSSKQYTKLLLNKAEADGVLVPLKN